MKEITLLIKCPQGCQLGKVIHADQPDEKCKTCNGTGRVQQTIECLAIIEFKEVGT